MPDPTPPPDPPHKHCWHRSPIQHCIDLHADLRCCHCGDDKCVRLERIAPPGHGPHLPNDDYQYKPRLIETNPSPSKE